MGLLRYSMAEKVYACSSCVIIVGSRKLAISAGKQEIGGVRELA